MLKKGISQQIALVLLIGFTIAILTIVFLWGKNYLEERAMKQGKIAQAKLNCENIDLSIIQSYQQGSNAIIVIKNKKDIKIPKLTFRFEGTTSETRETFDSLKNLEVKKYEIQYSEDIIKELKRIVVIPWTKVALGYYLPCNKNQISASLS